MKPCIIMIVALLTATCASTAFAAAKPGESFDFELSPVAPPTPVLKYHFLFRYAERRQGNAVIPILTATNLVGVELTKKTDDAEEAFEQNRSDFQSLAKKAESPAIMALLDLAGRSEQCDWDCPVREQGASVMLPYLNTDRALANLVRIHALQQMQDGRIDDSLASLRLGYELGRNVARGPTLVGGLVGVGIIALMNDALKQDMNRPESPNLYWALATLPHPMIASNLQAEEGAFLTGSIPELAGKNPQDLSADQWHRIYKHAAEIVDGFGLKSANAWDNEQTVADEVAHTLPEAQDDYAKRYGLPADQVEQLDPFKVVCTFWYQQFLNAADDQTAPTLLPFPIMRATMQINDKKMLAVKQSAPANPFLDWIPYSTKAALTYVKIDRMISALTDVEALRSYAAAHNGSLPAQLSDITDTPVLDNPYTCKPFEYQLQNGTATLADSAMTEYPLKYTIRIRP